MTRIGIKTACNSSVSLFLNYSVTCLGSSYCTCLSENALCLASLRFSRHSTSLPATHNPCSTDFRKGSRDPSSIWTCLLLYAASLYIFPLLSIPQQVRKKNLPSRPFLFFFSPKASIYVCLLFTALDTLSSGCLPFTPITDRHKQLQTIITKISISKAHLYMYLHKFCDKAFSQIKC